MQRSRLKNIINKSKTISNKQEIGNPFEEFKKSLPDNIKYDDNYRLEAAWKAYGSPKTYKEAIWEGLIQPIDENNYKLPSIGYNEETDEYEYLNKGQDNETVAKDIRVWDNDVIPLVQELKLGGYVRTFNEEKDCWTYTKNSQKREQPTEDKGEQVIDSFQEGEKIDKKEEINNNISEVEAFKQGGQMTTIPSGSLHARKNGMELAEKGEITSKGIPVVDNDGNQQAEIERNEVIFNHSTTTKLEELYKKFSNTDNESEKSEIAIKAGKILTDELINNTQDNTGLIQEVAEKNNLEYNK